LQSDKILNDGKTLFLKNPGIRTSICRYLATLNFSQTTSSTMLEILSQGKYYDDVALFYLVKTITDWHIPDDKYSQSFLNKVYQKIDSIQQPFEFYCALWFAAKYQKPNNILNLIDNHKFLWMYDSFLRRQVVSVMPRILSFKPDYCSKMFEKELNAGVEDSMSVANNISYLAQLETFPSKINSYLFPNCKQNPYPLSKYLILLCCLNSKNIQNNDKIKAKVMDYIHDPWYKKRIEMYIY
jgi:hypothetical protein